MAKEIQIYRNPKTRSLCYIIGKKKGLLHVQYYFSGMRSWFKIHDFTSMFVPVPPELNRHLSRPDKTIK